MAARVLEAAAGFPVGGAAVADAIQVADAHGLDRDLAARREAKYDAALENDAAVWIETITGESGVKGNFADALKSGVVLCRLLNKIKPSTVKSIHEGSQAFKQRENISKFIVGAQQFGVHNSAVFSPDDLYEQKNLGSVLNCVLALGGAIQTSVPEFRGPKLGVPDMSNAQQDKKRDVGPATQLGGLQATMAKASIDTAASVARNNGGATSAGGVSKLNLDRSRIDAPKAAPAADVKGGKFEGLSKLTTKMFDTDVKVRKMARDALYFEFCRDGDDDGMYRDAVSELLQDSREEVRAEALELLALLDED